MEHAVVKAKSQTGLLADTKHAVDEAQAVPNRAKPSRTKPSGVA